MGRGYDGIGGMSTVTMYIITNIKSQPFHSFFSQVVFKVTDELRAISFSLSFRENIYMKVCRIFFGNTASHHFFNHWHSAFCK